MQLGKYPDAVYRVSLKVIIRNADNEVLVVKEKGSHWSLPGGGIDHGESAERAIKRELFEEVQINAPFKSHFVGTDAFYIEANRHWQMWLVYELLIKKGYMYGVGADADEVAFIDPRMFKNSLNRSEKLVYKWCVDRAAPIS